MKLDWESIFMGDLNWNFAAEILIRTFIMFIMILVVLRMSGKRGVRQLSLFEVAIIIGLGSAAGDPMFHPDVSILPALLVFVTILLFYRLVTWLASRSEFIESLVEGDPLCVVEGGKFVLSAANKHGFAKDEFFAEMRQKSIEHLGQVKTAILETNGNMSFYYYEDDDVKPGLPIVPKAYLEKTCTLPAPGEYACTYCGNVETINTTTHDCERCKKDEWVTAISNKRIP